MKPVTCYAALFLVLSLYLARSVIAQTVNEPAADLSTRNVTHHENHVISADGKTVSTYRFATQVLKANAVESVKQTSISVSKSAQKLDVLEAYTLKAGGKKIAVPPSSWQVRQDTGRGKDAPIFSDQVSTSLVFPDVSEGDTVVLAYRISTREPLFPGKVSLSGTFVRLYAYDDVRVTVDAPASMKLQTQAQQMRETTATQGQRRVTTWTFDNKTPARAQRQNWSVFDVESEPGFLVSSFDDWADVARSYVARATPKAAVTPQVRELAQQVAKDTTDVRETTRLLHEWVATQVGYAGNCVGIGAVVPRDLDVVLKHRIGDCKDHATLLQALLTARGIESHQVLVNASSIYKLPQVPVAAMVNHVINYVPALGLFIDSTDNLSPLGRLPVQVYGKPVLAADARVPAKTPADAGGNTQTMRTRVELAEDGSAQGRVEVQLGGMYAIRSRGRLKDMNADTRARFVKEVFRNAGLEAAGTFEHDDPALMRDTFSYRATFQVKGAIRYPGTGAMGITGWFYNEAPAAYFAQAAVQPVEEVDSMCSSAQSTEEYEITLPASMQVIAVPQDTAYNTAILGYEASYKLAGRVLRVRREVQDRTPGSVCSPQTLRDFKTATEGVLADHRQQLLYR
jgi:transglutaminase-like putative cysteine protease